MTDEQRKDMVTKMSKFCPACNVVYFGATWCGTCNRDNNAGWIELVPIPFDGPTISSGRETKSTGEDFNKWYSENMPAHHRRTIRNNEWMLV